MWLLITWLDLIQLYLPNNIHCFFVPLFLCSIINTLENFPLVHHVCWSCQIHNFVPSFFTNINPLNNDKISFLDINSQVHLAWHVETIGFFYLQKRYFKTLRSHQHSVFMRKVLTKFKEQQIVVPRFQIDSSNNNLSTLGMEISVFDKKNSSYGRYITFS
jgi:hypothetical protein